MPSSSAHASTVVIRREGPVAVVLANNPPVNVITAAVRRDLRDAFAQIATDPTVQSVVLACAGSTFFSGADISEFGSDPGVIEDFHATCDAIEQCEQPVLAAIQGFAFGAGLELALSCHYRLSTPTAKVGLPEVTLGVLPGAGGTQRAPRLMGAAEALKLILGGGPLSASVACQKGLIDEVVQEDLLTAAVARAAELAAQRTRLRRTSQLAVDPATVPPTLFADARDDIARRMPASFAPARIVDCVEAATRLPFAEGLAVETRLVWDCMCSPQSAALRHGFFAERELSKVPGLPKGTTARELKRVGVLGAGALGARIAADMLDANLAVVLVDESPAALDEGLSRVRAAIKNQGAQLSSEFELSTIADCDLVIDAQPDGSTDKPALFARLGAKCRAGAVLAATTTQDIGSLAAASGRPQDVLGLHFESPKVLEIVRGTDTAADTLATAMKLAKSMARLAVVVGGGAAIAPRMLARYRREVEQLMREGVPAARVDTALEAFGMAEGPCRSLGVADVAAEASPAQTLSDALIVQRCLQALAEEGTQLINEGLAYRPGDIDIVWIKGLGYPALEGGPMHTAAAHRQAGKDLSQPMS